MDLIGIAPDKVQEQGTFSEMLGEDAVGGHPLDIDRSTQVHLFLL